MTRFVEYEMENASGTLLFEVKEPEPVEGKIRNFHPVDKVRRPLEQSLTRIKPAAESVLNELKNLSEKPDTVTVEFGIKLGAMADAIITSGTADCSYKVTLTWNNVK
jgi:hypothetical protein